MSIPSKFRRTVAADCRIDEIRRIFEFTVTLAADRREPWLIENVSDAATRRIVGELLAADERIGLFDTPF